MQITASNNSCNPMMWHTSSSTTLILSANVLMTNFTIRFYTAHCNDPSKRIVYTNTHIGHDHIIGWPAKKIFNKNKVAQQKKWNTTHLSTVPNTRYSLLIYPFKPIMLRTSCQPLLNLTSNTFEHYKKYMNIYQAFFFK